MAREHGLSDAGAFAHKLDEAYVSMSAISHKPYKEGTEC
jgi:hypothetical protein